jgi:hypothetical protein
VTTGDINDAVISDVVTISRMDATDLTVLM